MAYPSYLAATLAGASVRQLQYWRDSDLLEPEFGKAGGRHLYSFADVVALRTFVFLREQASLQLINNSDPILSPLSPALIGSNLNVINNGVKVAT